jgi:hypothetical protein
MPYLTDLKASMLEKIINITDNTPIIDLGNRVGSTGYVDFINFKEVNNPIVHGIDVYKRKFIVFKFQVDDDPKIYMQTLFQRYTDNKYDWRPCGHSTRTLIDNCGPLTSIQLTFLYNLFTLGSEIITEKEKADYNFENKRVYIRDKPQKFLRFNKSKIWNCYNNSVVSLNTLSGMNRCYDNYQLCC